LVSQNFQDVGDGDTPEAPWEVIRWTKLKKMSGQVFSEMGKRNFGRATCIAVSATIALGTSKGMILVFDYHQNLKTIIGPGTLAVESGSVTSVAFSADHSTVAGGHANGNIFTWEVSQPAKPFLQMLSTDLGRMTGADTDGHVSGVAILHLGFLGTRHTAVVSADDKGMAFSHLATRGLGALARSVRTTRVLGRYPDLTPVLSRPKKPSSVLAFSPLPMGNAEHATDSMGLVAMLTPYLLVVVSTTPIAQTQHKASRPKELAAHGAMSAALAWYPCMKLGSANPAAGDDSSKPKLAYSWLNVLTLLDVNDVSEITTKDRPPDLQFKPRKRWKAEESIVAMQWLSRSVIAVITVSQQLIILEDISLHVTDSSDLLRKHIFHVDLFSQHLSQLVEKLDEEDTSMHGVVADAFYMSFKCYKGRLFLLGVNDVLIGTLSNWADRLLALMERGDFIGAIRLATSYYNGDTDKATVGLPDDSRLRHEMVQEKLLEMMSASLKYAFGKNEEARISRVSEDQLQELANACFAASLSVDDMDFLFEDVYAWYVDGKVRGIFLQILDTNIQDEKISIVPPLVLKDLVNHFVDQGLQAQLEETICRLNPETMDIDQITNLCKRYKLYDALFYVWNQALGDYTTILKGLLEYKVNDAEAENVTEAYALSSKVFPYLSYTLTGRIYPTGDTREDEVAQTAKADIYHFFFSGTRDSSRASERTYPNLRSILDLDAPSFLSMLNEAFEDSFLNGNSEIAVGTRVEKGLSETQRFGLSLNRQYVVSILLEVMARPAYRAEDVIYLDMFIARNLPKFPQFILLPGAVLQRILTELCEYPSEDVADDCQLSVEYLLSVYQPPDLLSTIPLLSDARFYRVIKSIYRSERQYALLLQTCIEDTENPAATFQCIGDCLQPTAQLSAKQVSEVRAVMINHTDGLLRAGITQLASTLDRYAPDLHDRMLDALGTDEHAQYQYLGEILEPPHEGQARARGPMGHRYVEQYVRLLCDFDPHHVRDYVDQLKATDLRLDEVLPALESSGVIDALVVLLAREGKVQQAIGRLTQHLTTLEAALLGLLDGARHTPDAANTQEAADDLVESLRRYTRVGIWLCQGQAKHAAASKPAQTRPKRRPSLLDTLSAEESVWLELVDAVVQVTRNVGEAVDPTDAPSRAVGAATLLPPLRALVQETFAALLASTSTPSHPARSPSPSAGPPSFLRILRAFLQRAAHASPSLATLRAVLAAIFAASTYEASLLRLANRLLDADLFVRVAEVAARRRRGWRPLGQACAACSRRAWGPGVGAGVWEMGCEGRGEGTGTGTGTGKGKGRQGEGKGKAAAGPAAEGGDEGARDGPAGPLVILSCRHVFHRACLEEMLAAGEQRGEEGVAAGQRVGERELVCPLQRGGGCQLPGR
jgi:hypothetical protein